MGGIGRRGFVKGVGVMLGAAPFGLRITVVAPS